MAWGRPVQTNPLAYTRRYKLNTGRMLVSIAGPTMNLLMALLASLVIVIASHAGHRRTSRVRSSTTWCSST